MFNDKIFVFVLRVRLGQNISGCAMKIAIKVYISVTFLSYFQTFSSAIYIYKFILTIKKLVVGS